MVSEKDDALRSFVSGEQSGKSPAERDATATRKAQLILGRKALEAKKKNDARAYAEILKALQIRENSEEWKNAWKHFYAKS
jgi:hypothetical protein